MTVPLSRDPGTAPVPVTGACRNEPCNADAVLSSPRAEALGAEATALDRAQGVALHDRNVRSALATFTIASGTGIGARGADAGGPKTASC